MEEDRRKRHGDIIARKEEQVTRLFEPTKIASMTLANRFIRSATWEGLAGEDGSATPRLTDLLMNLVRGGVGLIITGHAFVKREGQVCPWQLGIHDDDLVPGLKEMTGTIHKAGGSIAIQLAHGGSCSDYKLSGLEPLGPSVLRGVRGYSGREMTEAEIKETIKAFAHGALRAKEAGFDAVQIHGAHGYLVNQFLSPFSNKRKDDYGGDVRRRAQFALEVVRSIRKAVGLDWPVLIKINAEDFLYGGFTREDMLITATMLEEEGVDAVEMSGGTPLSGKRVPARKGRPAPGETEAYYETAAREYKEKIGIPLMLVGGIRSLETCERLIDDGIADYISLSRPLIREPGLVKRWQRGDRAPALCVSDSGCFGPPFEGRGIRCVEKDRRVVA